VGEGQNPAYTILHFSHSLSFPCYSFWHSQGDGIYHTHILGGSLVFSYVSLIEKVMFGHRLSQLQLSV
jgi:hypothetical protein